MPNKPKTEANQLVVCRWCGTATKHGTPDGSCSFMCAMEHRLTGKQPRAAMADVSMMVGAVNLLLNFSLNPGAKH